MRTVTDWLGEYGASHSNPTNKLLHWVCVPPIVLAVMGLLWSLPVPEAFAGFSPWLNWATLAATAALVYYFALSPALAIGLFSLLLWRWTDDLRLYFWVQFFPGLAVLLLFLLYPPKYTAKFYWLIAVALYALAKVFEFSDSSIYSAGYLLSCHTLKHLTAAACFAILQCFRTRRLVS